MSLLNRACACADTTHRALGTFLQWVTSSGLTHHTRHVLIGAANCDICLNQEALQIIPQGCDGTCADCLAKLFFQEETPELVVRSVGCDLDRQLATHRHLFAKSVQLFSNRPAQCSEFGPATPLECIHSSHTLADDQGVDVVGAFVGLYGFQVHHVAHEGVFVGYAVGAEDVAGFACAF
jgi:hypothetical protein